MSGHTPDRQRRARQRGVPFERPAQFGTRAVITDAEYAKRIDDVRIRDARDLERVDVLSGKMEGPNAPIPHWREYNPASRRTSDVVDPPDGRHPRGLQDAGVFEYAGHQGNQPAQK